MTNYKQIALAGFLFLAGQKAAAFQPNALGVQVVSPATTTSTQLNVMPPMIISGALKKYKDEQEKKKMPMASRDEAKKEAAGLRVGASVWKWPPVWPYDDLFFLPPEDVPQKPMDMNAMASMFSGIQQTPEQVAASGPTAEEEEAAKLDVFQFWGEEKGDVRTEMDAESVEKVQT